MDKTSSLFLNILLLISIFSISFQKLENLFPSTKQELRAVWITPLEDSSLIEFTSKEEFIKNMNYILTVLKSYNMNAMVYHIRTHNNAMYNSKLNPLSPYWSKVNFNEFDPLKWLISECHKKGIEFHAWLNPYRVKAKTGVTKEEVAEEYTKGGFTMNPASDTKNLLLGLSGDTPNIAYMNPAFENVRNFISDTIEEIIENYDVDAIHFDDYFYYNMGANGATSGSKTILIEEDQGIYEEYIDKHGSSCIYKKDSAPDKADWRREQVNQLIELLHDNIKQFNKKNNRFVQLGISPSGVWKSGNGEVTYNQNGDAISTGSKTTTDFEHYGSYLFANTLYWINNEWIDYMMPQSYWATNHPACPYIDLMDWWNKVAKYKKVNIYSGHGLYMSDRDNCYAWTNDENEFSTQLKFLSETETLGGSCVYHFSAIRKYYDKADTMSSKQVKKALGDNGYWGERTVVNEIKSFGKIILSKVTGFKVNGNVVSFNKVPGAKFYAIYRKEEGKYKLLDVIGGEEDTISYTDEEEGTSQYNVRPISYSNTLGEDMSDSSSNSNWINAKKIWSFILLSLLL